MSLLNNIDIVRVTNKQLESTTISSTYVDMSGYEGCLFIATGSTLFNSPGGFTMNVTGTAAASTVGQSNYGTVTGSTVNLASSAVVNYKTFMVDCYKPEKRYLRCHLEDGASTDYITSIHAVRYGARSVGSTMVNQSTTIGLKGVVIGTS